MDNYIAKPVKKAELLRIINKYTSSQLYNNKEKTTTKHPEKPKFKKINGEEVIDAKIALNQLDGDSNLYKKICLVYKNKSQEKLDALEKAIDKKSFQEAERLSHSLKSSSENIGAENAKQIACKLEINLIEGIAEITLLKMQYEKLKFEVSKVLTVLNDSEWLK